MVKEVILRIAPLVFAYLFRSRNSDDDLPVQPPRKFFNFKAAALICAVLLGLVGLCVLDLRCSSSAGSGGGPLDRVKSEVAAGRHERDVIRRDQLAEQLRDLRVLNRRVVREGNAAESRRLTALILDLQKQYDAVDRRIESH